MWFAKVYDPLQAGSIDGTDVAPHDNAIKRAQLAHYDPPKNLATDPNKTLFIGRLNFNTTEESLRSYFERYGVVEQVRLVRNLVTGISQGYGFITFEDEHSARTAYDKANHAVLDDHVVLVDYERSRGMKGWIPRRLGGGFGGKKESGQLRFGARDKPFRWPIKTSQNDPGLNISHDQKRSDNWRLRTSNHSPSRRSGQRRRSESLRKRDRPSSRRHERSSYTYRDEQERRDRSPRRYHRDDRSSRSRHQGNQSPRRYHRDRYSSPRRRH